MQKNLNNTILIIMSSQEEARYFNLKKTKLSYLHMFHRYNVKNQVHICLLLYRNTVHMSHFEMDFLGDVLDIYSLAHDARRRTIPY